MTRFDVGRTSTGITAFPVSSLRATTLTQRHNAGALILGFDAAIDVTSRLALVPEIRALAFSTPGAGGGVFLIRPGIGVRWNF